MTETPHVPDFDLDGFTPYRLAVAAQKLSEQLAKQYRVQFGISIPEWRVLVHLHHAGDVSVRDIEARVDMEKSKVSRAASRLETAGYITKGVNDTDRRLLVLRLTDKGEALVARLLPVAMEYQDEMRARLGPLAEGLEAGLSALLSDNA